MIKENTGPLASMNTHIHMCTQTRTHTYTLKIKIGTSKYLKRTRVSVSLKWEGHNTDSITTTRRSLGFTNRCLKKMIILFLKGNKVLYFFW